jgi:4-oxalocrotonate tautomerase
MPLVQITLIEGRSDDRKEELIGSVTDVVVDSLGSPRESVRVVLYEVPAANWGVAGESKLKQSKED